jgi:hypothetical protein
MISYYLDILANNEQYINGNSEHFDLATEESQLAGGTYDPAARIDREHRQCTHWS